MAYHSPWSSLHLSRSQPHSPSTRKHLSTTLHSSQSLTGRPSIMTYCNTQYSSASAALDAYITDFENQNPSMMYHRTVEDLLSPRSLLQMTVQRSLEAGVRDTKDEERRYNVKKMLDESYHQIMRADIEMQKARELVKSSKLLSQSPSDPYMSPLPGSSNITDQLTDITMSTDAMIQAPVYPEKHREPARTYHHDGYGTVQEHNLVLENVRDKVLGNTSTRQNGVHKTPRVGNLSDRMQKHMYDSTEAVVNAACSIQDTRNLYPNHQTSHNSSRVTFKKPISSTNHHHLSKSSSLPKPQVLYRDTRHSNMGTSSIETTDTASSIGRPPPSWIEDLESTGRPPPSWIDDLDTSGRPPPSWIQDLDVSGVTLRSSHAHHPSQMSRYKDIEHTLEVNRPGNLRNLSSASELLISRAQTRDRSQDLKITDLENVSTSSEEEKYKSATKLRENMYREHDQRMLAQQVPHHRQVTNETRPILPSSHELDTRYKYKFKVNQLHHNSQNYKTKEAKMNESFTTDDLLKVSPTGRDFDVSKMSKLSPSSGKKSHRYSMNRSPKVARKSNSSNSGMGDGGQSARSKHRTQRLAASQYTRDLSLSTTCNTESLIYTPPRVGVGSKRLHDSRHSAGTYGKTGARSDSGQKADEIRVRGHAVNTPKETRSKERTRRLVDMTETPRTRLQSSPSGESTSAMPSLRTSPIAVGVDHARSFLTEDVLEGDRSWERNLPSIKAPQPVEEDSSHHQDAVAKETTGVMEQFLDDCLVSSNQSSPRLTNGRQPGPVEALKNMLFTLQQITPEQQAEQDKQQKHLKNSKTELTQKAPASWSSPPTDVKSSLGTASSTTTTDFDEAPGGKSLQRAMHHLSKLKSLVYDSPSSMEDDQSSKPTSSQNFPQS